jgi:aminoglycoside phosphotransferase (APT) family kinase protein
VNPDIVSEAVARFRLDVAEIDATPDSYSSTVRLITLNSGERLILKIPFTQHKLHRELRALQELHQDLPVPTVVDAWVPEDDGPGAMLLSHLPGQAVREPVSPELTRAMGALLANLHSHRLHHFGEVFEPPVEPAMGWWQIMHLRFLDWLQWCTGVLSEDIIGRTRETYQALLENLPEPDGPCWIHADFRPGNILVEGDRITGLIDFESARGGSAGFDFTKISNTVWDTTPGGRVAFIAGYTSMRACPEIDRALPYYRLHNAVGGLAWCIRRTDTDDPFFRENLAVLTEILGQRALGESGK